MALLKNSAVIGCPPEEAFDYLSDHRSELETVAYDRPRSWTMHNGGPIEVTFTCTLEPVPAGARLTSEFRPTPHGWFRLVFPLFLLVIRRQEKQNMGLIKGALEHRADAGPDR